MQSPVTNTSFIHAVNFRRVLPYCAVVILTLLVTGLTPLSTAYAASPTPERLQLLRERCDALKTRLTFIQKTEAADRIKRGRAYDQDILPYVSAFNSRIAANKVDAPELIRIAAGLQDAVGRLQFGSQYSVYTDDLTGGLHSDCKAAPDATNDWLDKARIDRATLAATVKQADALITDYIAELEKLKVRYNPVINQTVPGNQAKPVPGGAR